MASQDILSKTLSSITAIKLDQLQKQLDSYKTKKSTLLTRASPYQIPDPAKRTAALLNGAKQILPSSSSSEITSRPTVRGRGGARGRGGRVLTSSPTTYRKTTSHKQPELSNLDVFIEQSEFDPSVTDSFLKDTEDSLLNKLDAQSNKYGFASLYGRLVNEWIASGQKQEEKDDLVVVGRQEMHEQRKTWEEYIFQPKETDINQIKEYLNDVFKQTKEAENALELIRSGMNYFQDSWWKDQTPHFNTDILKSSIRGMLKSDALMEDKRTTIKEFLGNDVVLSEIADVLNVRMAGLDTWNWDSPLIVEQRRNLNGRYRFYLDEDLLHSIFIYYIGLRFAVELRRLLMGFVHCQGVWKSDTKPISPEDTLRQVFFLSQYVPEDPFNGSGSVLREYAPPSDSVQAFRDQEFFRNILLDQLPESMDEVRGNYGDDAQAFESTGEETRKSHTKVVQGLLQELLSEIAMAKGLGKEMAVIRSDFAWFGPSLPHSSIFAVLEFFGVNNEWIAFFKRVLEAPIRFKDDDSSDTPDRIRKRGTPISTPMADFFAESLLFCLDYAVNQKADGTKLYRLHDDIWLRGRVEQCIKAWDTIIEFKDIMGLELNQAKTGSALISGQNGITGGSTYLSRLPSGDVTWGFLKLDPETGRFKIRQDEVDKHIQELRLQLDGCRSVLDFVQAWNIYGYRFFVNNFGRPCQAYGRGHMDSMLATFRRIQEAVAPGGGGVGKRLKEMIASRFGLSPNDIPDGFLYYPTLLGGLGLKNPFIAVLLRREYISERPEEYMEIFHRENEATYYIAKNQFETRADKLYGGGRSGPQPLYDHLRNEAFMSLEEFTKYAERTSSHLKSAFDKLKKEADDEVEIEPRGDVAAALVGSGFVGWDGLSSDEKWVVQLYHKEVVKKFGGLVIVDEGLLPTGLIAMLRESRFKWQG